MKAQVRRQFREYLTTHDLCWSEAIRRTISDFSITQEIFDMMDLTSELDKPASRILVACEESQAITSRLIALGFDAWSCDLLPASGSCPERHLQKDCLEEAYSGKYDMMIAHPPCTFLSVAGAKWMYHPEDGHLPTSERRPHPNFPTRRQDQLDALDFVQKLMDAPIERIVIENPVSVISSQIRKADQTVHPYQFGDEAKKSTCLWLKNVPLLTPTKIVGKGEVITYKSGKTHAKWYADALTNAKTDAERRTLRSKTFAGMADAMANQWTKGLTPMVNTNAVAQL
jgi:site-specific DNA-cytosine methylase